MCVVRNGVLARPWWDIPTLTRDDVLIKVFAVNRNVERFDSSPSHQFFKSCYRVNSKIQVIQKDKKQFAVFIPQTF